MKGAKMKDTDELVIKICSIGCLIVMLASLFVCFALYTRTKAAENRLIEYGCSLREEMKETEEKCQRYCDTCIDILANARWE